MTTDSRKDAAGIEKSPGKDGISGAALVFLGMPGSAIIGGFLILVSKIVAPVFGGFSSAATQVVNLACFVVGIYVYAFLAIRVWKARNRPRRNR